MLLRRPSKRTVRWSAVATITLIAFALLDYWFYPLSLAGGESVDRGENGLWLRYTWYFGQYTSPDLDALAVRLRAHRIGSAYFHVRFIGKSGSLKFHYPAQARNMNEQVRRRTPEVIRFAYVFIGNPRGGGSADLSDPVVRRKMVAEAVWLIDTCRFDGIHWDYEVCRDGDTSFLSLLDSTRKALPGVPISIAAPIWMPPPLHRFGWSEAYYAQVAKRCDEIAVMCYDTGFVTPRSYDWIVEQNVARVCAAAAKGNPRCRVLIGLPTYVDGTRSHNPKAESLALGLYAVKHAPHPPNLDGVALFADYTTDDSEWATFDKMWKR